MSACHSGRMAFTLIELLAALTVIAVLALLGAGAFKKAREAGQRTQCVSNLRQLGLATHLYLADHNRHFFHYVEATPDGPLWYFGLEGKSEGREGSRELDQTRAPLYPYIQQVGGVEVCPSFPYDSALWKPKFKGASYGYGFNILLSGKTAAALDRPSQVIVFGDCAQVNTFQPPASSKNPMLEEFYMIESTFKTVHFRHGGKANFLFADGHVEALAPHPGTLDTRIKGEIVGRISPVGSLEYLR